MTWTRAWSRGGLGLLLLVAPGAGAQDTASLPSFDLERLELNAGRGPLAVGSGELLPEGELRVSLLGHYQRDPLTLNGGEERLSLIRARATGVLAVAWGVTSWLELSLRLPALAQQAGSHLEAQGITPPGRGGLGAPRLGGRLGLLRREAADPVDLALELGVGLPLGSERALARETRTSVLAQVMVGSHVGDVLATAFEAGVLLRPTVRLTVPGGEAQEVGNELRFGTALTTLGETLRAELDLNAALSWGSSNATLEVLGGARFTLAPGAEVFLLGGPGFGAEPGTPLFRVLAGVTFIRVPPTGPDHEPSIVQELVPLAPAPEHAEEDAP